MNTIENLKGIVFGTPLTEQAIAELSEASGQVAEALKHLEAGLSPTEGNIVLRDVLLKAQIQLQQAQNGLVTTRYVRTEDQYYQKEAQLGAHRVREAITNLKDVLRMLKVPE